MLQINIKSFQYPTSKNEVLSGVSFELKKGEHLAILGESGCGKSTLLHLIYGLLNLEQGEIFYGKKQLFGPSHNLIPGHDSMKLVSQENTLMPFISVAETIGEHLPRIHPEEDNKRIAELLDAVGLAESSQKKVQFLSGGQKQRVALAKALVTTPEVLLLDEPFSSIDTFRKNKLRYTLFRYLKKHQITCITATHDAEEALSFSDRLLVLKDGEMLQMNTPEKVYTSANSVYEKSFYGEVSTIPAGIFSEKEFHLFPHQLKISAEITPLKATVKASFFKGRTYLILGEWNSGTVFFEHFEKLNKEATVYLSLVR
ncbi:MAG: ABC transporter ATP-binding protein [Flavobacteriaceae bacterium]|nr:ABC transporter ATP-binding protein [Flavobacteriaceae bacterium]